MKIRCLDLIEKTFEWPQDEFFLEEDHLRFHGIDLMELIERDGTPLRFTYLPRIGESIRKATGWFESAMDRLQYSGSYHYCYVTKSSHFDMGNIDRDHFDENREED